MTASRRSDHTDATRRALVDAGRYLFARRDYGDVSIEDIVTRARVTRGALDYHFDSKKDLFQTVLEVVEADLVADVEAAIAKVTDAWICWSSASTPSLTRRPNRMRCRSLRLTARQCSGGANGAGSTCARAWSAGRGSRTRDGRRGDSARTVATTFASAAGRANRIRAADRGRDGQRPDQSRGRTRIYGPTRRSTGVARPRSATATDHRPQSRPASRNAPRPATPRRPGHHRRHPGPRCRRRFWRSPSRRRAPAPYRQSSARPTRPTLFGSPHTPPGRRRRWPPARCRSPRPVRRR